MPDRSHPNVYWAEKGLPAFVRKANLPGGTSNVKWEMRESESVLSCPTILTRIRRPSVVAARAVFHWIVRKLVRIETQDDALRERRVVWLWGSGTEPGDAGGLSAFRRLLKRLRASGVPLQRQERVFLRIFVVALNVAWKTERFKT
jgi:hypothetical protein